VNPGASNTAVILNLSGGPNSNEPPRTNTEEFGDVLLNEFSHTVTSQLLDEYIVRRTRGLVGTSVFNAPREEDLEREFMAGFTHPDIPGGLYNFSSYDELQSDAFSMSVSPEGIMGRYLIYGRTPLNPTSYDLNRDFTAHHLAEFLRINGHGNYSMSQVNQAFRRYYNAFNVGNRSEMQRLETVFQFNNPAFFAFIQPKYQVVGEALYRHMTNKINAL
jgi:hypothetical protein